MAKRNKLIYISTILSLIADVILAIFLLVLILFVMSLYFVYLG